MMQFLIGLGLVAFGMLLSLLAHRQPKIGKKQ